MAMIWFAAPREFVSRVLATRPMVAIGLISYSLYLWHYPLLAFGRIEQRDLSWSNKAVLISLAVGLAAITYHLVERPARDPRRIVRARFLPGVAMAGVALGTFVALGVWTAGFEPVFKERFPFYSVYSEVARNERQFDNGDCHFYAWEISGWTTKRLDDCYDRYGPGVFIVGDSHSRDIFNAVSLNMRTDFVFQLSWRSAECQKPGARRPGCGYIGLDDYMERSGHKIARIIYTTVGHNFFVDRQSGRRWEQLFEGDNVPLYEVDEKLVEAIGDFLDSLAAIASSQVVWLGPRLEPHVAWQQIVRNGCGVAVSVAPGIEENFQRLDRFLADFRAGVRRYRYASQVDAIGFNEVTDLFTCDDIFWYDGHHYSLSGEKMFGRRLVDYLTSAGLL